MCPSQIAGARCVYSLVCFPSSLLCCIRSRPRAAARSRGIKFLAHPLRTRCESEDITIVSIRLPMPFPSPHRQQVSTSHGPHRHTKPVPAEGRPNTFLTGVGPACSSKGLGKRGLTASARAAAMAS